MKTILAALFALSTAAFAGKAPILLVMTNHAELGDTGKSTGFYLSEASHPYKVFIKHGYAVTFASPKGGFAPIDPKSMDLEDEANKMFWEKFGNGDDNNPGVKKTVALDAVNPGDFSAIFFAGGHGAMWDFPDSEALQKVTTAIYENNGAVGAVCHGPAALVNVKLSDGSHLLSNKKTAVFTNSEEAAVKLTEVVPFLLQTKFEKVGAEVVLAKDFAENAVRDGRLVTGQNPASAEKSGELLVEAITE
jgi:putative intracellular protease/amidase